MAWRVALCSTLGGGLVKVSLTACPESCRLRGETFRAEKKRKRIEHVTVSQERKNLTKLACRKGFYMEVTKKPLSALHQKNFEPELLSLVMRIW